MNSQRGFALTGNLLIAAGVAGTLLLGALAVTGYLLLDAREALGAYQAREAQLEADVEAQALALADERAENERVVELLAATTKAAAAARRRAATADARYRNALRQSEAARDWAAARLPDAAIERLCDDEARRDPSGAGAGPATVCAARRASAAAADGSQQR